MSKPITLTLLIALMLTACTGAAPAEPIAPADVPADTTLALTESAPTNAQSVFPMAAELNPLLPAGNLLLARHFYGDPDEQTTGDEVCYDVAIYSDDTYTVISCQPNFTYPAPTGRLDETQAKFLHRWVETFQAFDEPAINGLLKFNGAAQRVAEFPDKVSMHAMLSELEWAAHRYEHRGGTPLVVFHARSVLAYQLEVLPENVDIRFFEAVTFPDECLDVPKPDEVCEPVVTEGFRIFLVAQGLEYEFHTDVWGYDIRRFGEPQTAPTQGPGG